MLHRGEIVEEAVRQSGLSLTVIAKRLGKSRRHLYNLFEDPHLSLDTILQIGKILYHDFSHEIPEIIQGKFIVNEPEKTYVPEDVTYWKDKYYALVDEHLAVVKQLREYEKKAK
jgi:plasmid maintenance system antidote protein VapI